MVKHATVLVTIWFLVSNKKCDNADSFCSMCEIHDKIIIWYTQRFAIIRYDEVEWRNTRYASASRTWPIVFYADYLSVEFSIWITLSIILSTSCIDKQLYLNAAPIWSDWNLNKEMVYQSYRNVTFDVFTCRFNCLDE